MKRKWIDCSIIVTTVILFLFIIVIFHSKEVCKQDGCNEKIYLEGYCLEHYNALFTMEKESTEKHYVKQERQLVEGIPYVGQDEESLAYLTIDGVVPTIEKCRDYEHLDYTHRYKTYKWVCENGKSCKVVVYYDDYGRGTAHSVDRYPKDPYGKTMEAF